VCTEKGEEDHDQQDEAEGPLAAGQKTRIRLLVRADIHGAVLIFGFMRHEAIPLMSDGGVCRKEGRNIAKAKAPATWFLKPYRAILALRNRGVSPSRRPFQASLSTVIRAFRLYRKETGLNATFTCGRAKSGQFRKGLQRNAPDHSCCG